LAVRGVSRAVLRGVKPLALRTGGRLSPGFVPLAADPGLVDRGLPEPELVELGLPEL